MNKGDTIQHQFVVDAKVHQGFIVLFNDKNPLHTDEAFARSKGFAGEVMHGNILNGFLSYFIGELLPLKNVIIHSQSIKYFNPVYLNDTILLKTIVNEVFPSVNTVVINFEFTNAANKRVAKGNIQIGII